MSHGGPRNPPSWTDVHFALFVLVDVSTDDINKLADTYPNAPRKEGDTYTDSSKTPIAKDWTSSFKGKSIPDASNFIKKLPDDATVGWHHFVVIGEDYLKGGIVNICRIGDEDLKGEELDMLPCSVEHSALTLMGLEPHSWAEIKSNVEDRFSPI